MTRRIWSRIRRDSQGEVSGDSNFVAEFLSSNEGIELNQAFARIRDRKLRRRIVELVRAVAGEDEGEVGAEADAAAVRNKKRFRFGNA